MNTNPGPRPPGTPGDCEALAAVCESYAAALATEVRASDGMHDAVAQERWTGGAARHVQQAVAGWQRTASRAADGLRDLAGWLRRQAQELAQDQAEWQQRRAAFEEQVDRHGR